MNTAHTGVVLVYSVVTFSFITEMSNVINAILKAKENENRKPFTLRFTSTPVHFLPSGLNRLKFFIINKWLYHNGYNGSNIGYARDPAGGIGNNTRAESDAQI